MKIKSILLLTWFVVGCKTASPHHLSSTHPPSLAEAKKFLKEGQLYEARKMTESVLKANSTDLEALTLMLEIVDAEREQHKQAFASKPVEEFTPDEKSEEAKTWLERSKLLVQLHQYEEALSAANNVFVYDPHNQEASELVDDINQTALREGQREILSNQKSIHSEVQTRMLRYRMQVKEAMQSGKWGAAKITVQKMLILQPEDREALRIQEQIRDYEKRKTF